MRICVLNSSYDGSQSVFQDHDPYGDPAPHLPEYEFERVLIHKATADHQLLELAQRGFDVFINLCDGSGDEDCAGIEVVQALERLGLPFTGARSAFYDPSRVQMKACCHAAGIKTPGAVTATCPSDVARAAAMMRFPLIVKHPNSYGSIGMTKESRVVNAAQCLAQGQRMIDTFGGALIEEFIAGREFTVLVAENSSGTREPLAFAPVEARFPPGESFKHFDLKWVGFQQLQWEKVTDPELAARLADIARRFFAAMQGTGYGRCDIRMSAEGELYVIEINPNCGIFYSLEAPGSADIILMNDPMGHRGFIEHIIATARARVVEYGVERHAGAGADFLARQLT